MDEPLDAESARRVLRRAQEIAAANGRGGEPFEDEYGVSGAALVEAAAEIGIDRSSVRDALALERFDADVPETQRFDGLAGAGSVVVEHVLDRSPGEAISEVEEWFTVTHRMRCVLGADGSLDCRPKPGVAATIGRSLSGATGDVNIKNVDRITVAAQVLEVGSTHDRQRTMLRVIADRGGTRRRRLVAGAAGGAAGVGAAVTGVVGLAGVAGSAVLGPVVAVPLIVGGFGVARSGSGHADRVELELLRVIAAVDRGERPVGLIGRARRGVRRATVSPPS